MGLIRVSDAAEEKIKRMAAESGRTVTSTVDILVEGNSGGVDLLAAVDKRFDELKSLLEDTAVDRLARVQKKKDPISIDWPDVQYLMFELLEEDAPEWTCKEASKGAHESSELEALTWLADDDFIYTTNGVRTNWLNITPRIKSYLGEHYDI
ncbi:MAG: hypothetical protein Q4F56_03275 [Candidatus Saccharibacteria bacterium]|nr:hypothetical protein [Candidatus Saccharibacteria bacterium]